MNYELVIKVENDQIIGHPMILSSLSSVITNFDPYNLPHGYAYFIRVAQPDLKWYEKSVNHSYGFVDGVVKDIYTIEVMSPYEKQQAKSVLTAQWVNMTGWSSWIFNEETGTHDSPIPYPQDGNLYNWNENTQSWIKVV